MCSERGSGIDDERSASEGECSGGATRVDVGWDHVVPRGKMIEEPAPFQSAGEGSPRVFPLPNEMEFSGERSESAATTG